MLVSCAKGGGVVLRRRRRDCAVGGGGGVVARYKDRGRKAYTDKLVRDSSGHTDALHGLPNERRDSKSSE